MCRFKHSPLFQRVLDFKKGDTAPKVQLDMNLRMGARRCRFVVVVFIVHEFGSNRFTRSIIHFHFNQIAYMFTGHAPLFIGPIDSQHPSSHVDADIT